MITTVLFDMGGTLENIWNTPETEALAIARVQELLRAHDLDPGVPPDAFRAAFLNGFQAYKHWANQVCLEKKPEEIWPDYFLRDFRLDRGRLEALSEELANMWECTYFCRELRAGAAELLRGLKQRGYRMGVISNNGSLYNVFNMLERYGIRDYMEDVTTSSITGYRKPHPEIFRVSMRQMRVKPEECVYVGDTLSRDIAGARDFGIGKAVLIPSHLSSSRDTGLDGGGPRPDTVLGELTDLLVWLDEQSGPSAV